MTARSANCCTRSAGTPTAPPICITSSKADGFETLTTHIFDPDDPYINSDAVFGVKESLLAEFKRINDPKRANALGFAGEFWEVEHNFVLAKAKS